MYKMPIDLSYETRMVADRLTHVTGYIDCERIVVKNLVRHFEHGFDDAVVEQYMKKLITHLESLAEACDDRNIQTNYRFASGFVHALLRTPTWKSWVKKIELEHGDPIVTA